MKKEDNSAYLRCDAINQAMQGPAMAEIGLRVECEYLVECILYCTILSLLQTLLLLLLSHLHTR